MTESEKNFENYKWDEDTKWQETLKNLETPANWSETKINEYLLKRKRKYYQTIDPSYIIPEEPKKTFIIIINIIKCISKNSYFK